MVAALIAGLATPNQAEASFGSVAKNLGSGYLKLLTKPSAGLGKEVAKAVFLIAKTFAITYGLSIAAICTAPEIEPVIERNHWDLPNGGTMDGNHMTGYRNKTPPSRKHKAMCFLTYMADKCLLASMYHNFFRGILLTSRYIYA